jgi:uncharacterized membrane protein
VKIIIIIIIIIIILSFSFMQVLDDSKKKAVTRSTAEKVGTEKM